MHTGNIPMNTGGEASSSGAVTTTTTLKPSSRKSNLRLQLASDKLLQVNSDAVLRELERANEVTPQLLDTIRELVSVTETFEALTDADKLKLVEHLIRKVCSKRRDDDMVFQVLLILQTVATKSDYSSDSWSLFHTIVDAFVSLLNGCDASDIRSKLLIVFRQIVAHRKRNGRAMSE